MNTIQFVSGEGQVLASAPALRHAALAGFVRLMYGSGRPLVASKAGCIVRSWIMLPSEPW